MNRFSRILLLLMLLIFGQSALASSNELADFTSSFYGIAALIIFVVAFILVIFEEQLHLPKSKPVLFAAGLIWILIAIACSGTEHGDAVEIAIRHNFLEYAELFFFLLVAMTYVNAMLERGVFEGLRQYLVGLGLSYRQLFWLTGVLAFFISPVADNLTTALVMCAVIMAVGKGKSKFIGLGCINIVVAANAGGAFSPFGDITTLMVWAAGIVEFQQFFSLFVPAVVNFMVPAAIMSFAIQKGSPAPVNSSNEFVVKKGGITIVFLFLATIVTAVCFHSVFHIPPVFGMMFGLAYLKIFAFMLKKRGDKRARSGTDSPPGSTPQRSYGKLDIFDKIAQAEWDTLFFFYGVILAVGGLGFLGYLSLISDAMYTDLGVLPANILVGLLSAIIDNIPVMFAVITMNPDMVLNEWLLVTLTAGVGGSLLSVGSAAGVALMGQARGHYSFFIHLKWTPVIALGYFASIGVHLLING